MEDLYPRRRATQLKPDVLESEQSFAPVRVKHFIGETFHNNAVWSAYLYSGEYKINRMQQHCKKVEVITGNAEFAYLNSEVSTTVLILKTINFEAWMSCRL